MAGVLVEDVRAAAPGRKLETATAASRGLRVVRIPWSPRSDARPSAPTPDPPRARAPR